MGQGPSMHDNLFRWKLINADGEAGMKIRGAYYFVQWMVQAVRFEVAQMWSEHQAVVWVELAPQASRWATVSALEQNVTERSGAA